MNIPSGQAICPVCQGSKVAAPPLGTPQLACRNCGGQMMNSTATGFTNIDPATGSGCTHKFRGEKRGNCYYVYTCTNGCGCKYDDDSSD